MNPVATFVQGRWRPGERDRRSTPARWDRWLEGSGCMQKLMSVLSVYPGFAFELIGGKTLKPLVPESAMERSLVGSDIASVANEVRKRRP
jgi:hypothetical protein